jgi:hypothetical protein
MGRERPDGVLVGTTAFLNGRRVQLAHQASFHRLPAIYASRDYAEAGGLMSYGSDIVGGWHQVGIYTGRILKGTTPKDLPVVQANAIPIVFLMGGDPVKLGLVASLNRPGGNLFESAIWAAVGRLAPGMTRDGYDRAMKYIRIWRESQIQQPPPLQNPRSRCRGRWPGVAGWRNVMGVPSGLQRKSPAACGA